jgi:cardiolipin synthase
LDLAFAATWRLSGPPLAESELLPETAVQGDSALRVVAGEPGGVRASRATELLLAGAAERVWITDAYLVAPRGIYQSLIDAARAGVDIRLLVPGTSDLSHVRNLTRIGYRDLLEAGVRIFEWRGPMLHAKTLVVDGRWVRIGSTNLNLSSLLANFEIDIVAEDVGLAQAMEARYRRDLDKSVEIKYRGAAGGGRRGLAAVPFAAEMHPEHHRPGIRERRVRAAVALWAVVAGARRTVFLQYTVILSALAVLFFFFPRTMAAIFAVLSLWLAIAAWMESWVRRST